MYVFFMVLNKNCILVLDAYYISFISANKNLISISSIPDKKI